MTTALGSRDVEEALALVGEAAGAQRLADGGRARVRIFSSRTAGARKVKVGKPGRLRVRKGAKPSCKGRTAPALGRSSSTCSGSRRAAAGSGSAR